MEGGHSYLVRGIPKDIWDAAIERADDEDRSIREVLIRMMKYYAKRGVPHEVDGASSKAQPQNRGRHSVPSRRGRK